LNLQPPDP